MVDSVNLNAVARDTGFKERVKHFLVKRADEVIDETTPDANELALSKTLLYPADTNEASFNSIVERFAQTLVTVPAVSTNLAANEFNHLNFTDSDFQTQVEALWTTYAKATA